MRELKGDWKDLFNGFMVALDLRKMFLGFCGLLFTVWGPIAATCWLGNELDPAAVAKPASFALGEIWGTLCQSWHVIFSGTAASPARWFVWLPYSIGFLAVLFAIWAYFGGAIARIAAVEIARDGERIETARALRFSGKKFWSFFMSPWICVIGLLFFAFCNFAGGLVGRLLDVAWIGGPIVALLLPLALLSGFIMTLIVIGSAAGYPLFTPAVAVEGTDSFDAVSRGFSYVYSRPWHYLWYQLVGAAYGFVCIAFVLLFSVTMVHLGLSTGGAGFDLFLVEEAPQPPKHPGANASDEALKKWRAEVEAANEDRRQNPGKYAEKYDRFRHVSDTAWAMILSDKHDRRNNPAVRYDWSPAGIVTGPHPYGRLMYLANEIVTPDYSMTVDGLNTKLHKVAAVLVIFILVITLGTALGYVPSYVVSQQTMIYYLLRKKVDGIEMNEVFDEPEEEKLAEAPKPAPEKAPEKAPEGEKKS